MGRKKYTIESCQQIAEERGGKCLSEEYVNCDKLMKWQCSKGHIWSASISPIKNRNVWCLDCGGTKKLTIEECKQVAKKRGGECLSEKSSEP